MGDRVASAYCSNEVLAERVSAMAESMREMREAAREMEKRIRRLEAEDIEAIKARLCRLEGSESSFKSAHDETKEKWNMALNFVVQLMWVATASFILAKLGLSGP